MLNSSLGSNVWANRLAFILSLQACEARPNQTSGVLSSSSQGIELISVCSDEEGKPGVWQVRLNQCFAYLKTPLTPAACQGFDQAKRLELASLLYDKIASEGGFALARPGQQIGDAVYLISETTYLGQVKKPGNTIIFGNRPTYADSTVRSWFQIYPYYIPDHHPELQGEVSAFVYRQALLDARGHPFCPTARPNNFALQLVEKARDDLEQLCRAMLIN